MYMAHCAVIFAIAQLSCIIRLFSSDCESVSTRLWYQLGIIYCYVFKIKLQNDLVPA